MSPEQLQAHQQWHDTHQPGPAAARARERQDRQYVREIQSRLEKLDEVPVSPELAALQAQVVALEEARDFFRRLAEEEQANRDQGVFG